MQISWCTETQLAPASAKAGMYSSGLVIIRWQSSGTSTTLRRAETTSGPMVMLGTKCPSMTSTCSRVAPPRMAAWQSSARWAKSADRMEGAISIKAHVSYAGISERFYHGEEAPAVGAGRAASLEETARQGLTMTIVFSLEMGAGTVTDAFRRK